MTKPIRFATIAGAVGLIAAGGLVLANRESDTSTFEKALNRISGNWEGTAQLFIPDGKSPVLNGKLSFGGRAREYRFVADFVADSETQKLMGADKQDPNITITKFLRLTPNGTYTLDETPIEFDNLSTFAGGESSNLKLVSKVTEYVEIVEFKQTGSSLEIRVATGKDKSSVKPNMVFRMNKVKA